MARGAPMQPEDVHQATMDGAVLRLRPKLMTVFAVLASLVPILWESGTGSDVMKPIATPIVGGMVTSTIAVLILVPVLFMILKSRQLRHGTLCQSQEQGEEESA
jgi:Cu(I)/Ag(I) efflux system membrane protein CusA/SilA